MPSLEPLGLSLQVTLCATVVVLLGGTLAAWFLSRAHFRGKAAVETILTLPLVLPPTVVGYYLLLTFGHGTPWGSWLNTWGGVHLLFTWQGAALAGAVMGFPLMVKTAAATMEGVEREYLEHARTAGAGEWQVFVHVLVPMSYRGILAGAVLAFARGLGEFGATLMIAGNIPGRTQTMPLALYTAVERGDDTTATFYSALLTVTSFAFLWAVSAYQRRLGKHR